MSNVITYFIGVSFLDFVIGLQNFRSTFLLNQGANWDFSVLSTLNWTILSTFDLIALHPLKAIVTDDRWGKTTVWLKKPQVKNSCSLIAGGNDMASAVIHIRYSLRISEQDFTSLLSLQATDRRTSVYRVGLQCSQENLSWQTYNANVQHLYIACS